MRAGEIVFTGMERVVFGRPAADAVVDAADRLGARRVFILASATLMDVAVTLRKPFTANQLLDAVRTALAPERRLAGA